MFDDKENYIGLALLALFVAIVSAARRKPKEPMSSLPIQLDDVLRDALSEMLEQETQYAPVVDQRGAVAGVLSIEIIGSTLAQEP